jgi:hypothetical protein
MGVVGFRTAALGPSVGDYSSVDSTAAGLARAVVEAVLEAGVAAETLDVSGVAAQGRGLADHIVPAHLLGELADTGQLGLDVHHIR